MVRQVGTQRPYLQASRGGITVSLYDTDTLRTGRIRVKNWMRLSVEWE